MEDLRALKVGWFEELEVLHKANKLAIGWPDVVEELHRALAEMVDLHENVQMTKQSILRRFEAIDTGKYAETSFVQSSLFLHLHGQRWLTSLALCAADGDGLVTREELNKSLKRDNSTGAYIRDTLDKNNDGDLCEKEFALLDRNRDGGLTVGEFGACMIDQTGGLTLDHIMALHHLACKIWRVYPRFLSRVKAVQVPSTRVVLCWFSVAVFRRGLSHCRGASRNSAKTSQKKSMQNELRSKGFLA